ncbi:MAG: GGDEF domain-containing protein [Hydrogenibacillus sp.]|nr:GGDEF domain-containing protein [Hydrogenibacillus sp.]
MADWAIWLERLADLIQQARRTGEETTALIDLGQSFLTDPVASTDERRAFLRLLSELNLFLEDFGDLRAAHTVAEEIFALSLTLFRTFDPEVIYAEVHRVVSRFIPADVFLIARLDQNDRVTVPYYVEDGERYDPVTLRPRQGLVGKVAASGKPLCIGRASELSDRPHLRWGKTDNIIESALFVPLFFKDRVRAVLSVQSRRPEAYDEGDERLLKIIGGQMLGAIASAELFQEVERLSYYDELTGLQNRRAFMRDIEEAVANAVKAYPVALVMIDSDDLKVINDRYGHIAGDRLLLTIADVLRRVEGEEIKAYRYGGDEFLLIIRGYARKEVSMRLKALQARFSRTTLSLEDRDFPVSVSVGAALCPDDADTVEGLVRAADEALYVSKTKGKNCVTMYTRPTSLDESPDDRS